MRIASLGHAGLYVETLDQRLLIDPVFAESLLGGILEYRPKRSLHLDRMPAPTAIVVSHAHFDHYHPESLRRLPRDVPLVAPNDEKLLAGLRELGFSDIRVCAPWQSVTLGKTVLVATPSGHDEPEMGVLVRDGTATFWHMADAEVVPADGARVLREHGRVHVVSAKYQPVVRASMGYSRTRGARFDAREVVDWLETACAVEPALVFPYASGLAFAGRHSWFNRYAFPYGAAEIAELLCRRLGPERSVALDPGDGIDVPADGTPHLVRGALAFVEAVPSPPVVWEPIDVSTLAGLDDVAERARLVEALDRLLAGPLASWLESELSSDSSFLRPLRLQGIVWQLVVEAGGGERIERFIDCAAKPLRVEPGRSERATSFTHVSGRGLSEVIDGRVPGIVFWLASDARSYDKTILVEQGRLIAPSLPVPEDEIGDPLTYYLRYRHRPDPQRAPGAGAHSADPGDLDVIARPGENPAVIEKKALLALLAEEEAARCDLAIGEPEVRATSDAFRRQFALGSGDDLSRWLREAGISDAAFTAVMRRFTAIRLVQERRAADIAAIVDDHRRISTVPRGKR